MPVHLPFGRFGRSFLLLVVLASLAGCGYEKGFEYRNDPTELQSLNNSKVNGSVVMGYGINDPAYRIRIELYWLSMDSTYYMHFFNSATCSQDDLAKSDLIDREWGLDAYPALISSNAFGTAEQEFRLRAPREFFDYSKPKVLPTIVITAVHSLESGAASVKQVACAKVSSYPSNRRPHT
ncbi:hypothetical protein [Massilia suwonensis]|uniref:Lipoprotein n=1 Tax=Massilia suwonensis TaxID=648895 RepID=A0ABW0ML72_9BURK